MKKLTVAALAAALVVPAASAQAATRPHPAPRTAAASAPMTAPTLAQRRAAASVASTRFGAAAPRLSAAQKARNADTMVRLLQGTGLSVGTRAIYIGRTQLGTMYRWGGTTPAGFDCSGFVQYTYRKAGKRLPRTAAAQQAALPRTSAPRPGDLVFFGKRAHHVGIYVGDGMMMDSPRTGRPLQVRSIYTSAVTYGRV